jgi:hypothetical protein
VGFLSKIGKQLKRSVKQVEKQVKRSGKQIKKQTKRSYDDAREIAQAIEPYVGAVLSVVEPTGTAASINQKLWGEGGIMAPSIKYGGEMVNIDPRYNVGGTPMGMGSMARPTPGTEVGGPPNPMTFYWPGSKNPINPLFLLGAGILVLYLALDGRRR